MKIGIRREDKSIWERRTPLIPKDAAELRRQGIDIAVEASPYRTYTDAAFEREGVPVQNDLKDCDIILGIKEIRPAAVEPEKIYLFFSHVIKGQPENMDMLRELMAKRATLIDYERITDDRGRRLIFFGRYAGLAGMVNALWSLGQRLLAEGISSPFARLRQMRTYPSLRDAETAVRSVGDMIRTDGLPDEICPLVTGFFGSGNVSRGAQEIYQLLPVQEISPAALASRQIPDARNQVYQVNFRRQDRAVPLKPGTSFDPDEYRKYGRERYKSGLDQYLPHLTILVNGIYWEPRYPRLVTAEMLRHLWKENPQPRLRVIADISCDINGAIESTVRATDPGRPVYVYLPESGDTVDGVEGRGPVVMAVYMLPAEIPREASELFSSVLKEFIPRLAEADFHTPFSRPALPPELKRAVILHQGNLTPHYRYLEKVLNAGR